MTATLEPIGLARRTPLGETRRIALLGRDEGLSPERAVQIGLVSEIVPRDELWTGRRTHRNYRRRAAGRNPGHGPGDLGVDHR